MSRDAVVVHPGVQHSADLAASLDRANRLVFLATRLQVGVDAPLPWRHEFIQSVLKRRIASALPDSRIRRVGTAYEVLERSVGRRLPRGVLKAAERRAGVRFNDRVIRMLGPDVKAVVGTDTASLAFFRRLEAERPEIARILDVSHPLDVAVQPMIRSDAARWDLPITGYDDYHEGPPADQRAELGSADIVVVASAFTGSTLAQVGFPEDRVQRVPYAVAPRPPQSRKRRDYLSVLALGAMSERKGMSLLLRAMRELENHAEPVRLTIAGRAAGGYALPDQLPSNTRYVGVPDAEGVRSLYSDADVLVLPSMCEGFGRTLLEALAAGVAAIATERSGGPDILERAPFAPLTILPTDRRGLLPDLLRDHARHPDRYLRSDDARSAAALFSEEHYLQGLQEAIDRAIEVARTVRG